MFKRKPGHRINDLFIKRWSPRAMSGEALDHEKLLELFEAARWAPSSYNGQPWRFIYAHRDTSHWEKLFGLLVPFNQSWVNRASVLVVIISKKTFEYNDKTARTHSFDTGSAWMSLALQGSMNGLVVHGMEGFDYEKAREVLRIPEDFVIEAMCAIGKPGKKEDLSAELQEREEPSDRRPLEDVVYDGVFSKAVV
ncbi:nitroreductase family protein [Candidatus Dependentiae bacterium]|nr:nitroreductase family protein [Candidatus Dependentiae bacterium]